jgi:hypothetical protein
LKEFFLDRSKLTERLGVLPFHALREIENGVKAALDID